MTCLTALLRKGFGKQLSPKPALTYNHYMLFFHLKVWEHSTNVMSALAEHHWARQGFHVFKRSNRLPVCPKLLKRAGPSVAEFTPNQGSGCLWKGHLPHMWFYVFFPPRYPQPKNNWVSRCCLVNGGLWKRVHTCAGVCKCGIAYELSVLFHYLNSFN